MFDLKRNIQGDNCGQNFILTKVSSCKTAISLKENSSERQNNYFLTS